MLLHEEENISTVVEQGTFYVPATETTIDEKAPLVRGIWKIVPGMILALIMPSVISGLSLIPFLAWFLLLAGLLPTMQGHKAFQVSTLLAAVGLVLSAWGYICGNILQSDPLPGILSKALVYGAMAVNLCIVCCYFLGLKDICKAASADAGIALVAFLALTLLGLLGGGTALLIAKICAALVCATTLVVSATKVTQ